MSSEVPGIGWMGGRPRSMSFLQFPAVVLMALIAGSVFGIWRGYDPGSWQPQTFLEVYRGAIGGLNTLLPVMGGLVLLMTALLAWSARHRGRAFAFYLAAFFLMASAALVTRFGNQPINAEIMTWTAATIPAGWASLRDTWWTWHLVRVAVTIAGFVALVAAVFADRR